MGKKMIIFDLDGTLADCEHRRHYVQEPDWDESGEYERFIRPNHEISDRRKKAVFIHKKTGKRWKPNWKAFYGACDRDLPNKAILSVFHDLALCDRDIVIWSGRCESAREKTIGWLALHIDFDCFANNECPPLKMRPISDDRPTDQLFGQWLDEYMVYPTLYEMQEGIVYRRNDLPEMAFSADPDVVNMFRRRSVFTFDCRQETSE